MSDDDESLTSRPQSPVSVVHDQLHTARPYRFTWDPSSRRPGPESVSGTTEGRGGGDYFSAQPRLGLLNTSSSLTLALGALPQEWSSAKHGFHGAQHLHFTTQYILSVSYLLQQFLPCSTIHISGRHLQRLTHSSPQLSQQISLASAEKTLTPTSVPSHQNGTVFSTTPSWAEKV